MLWFVGHNIQWYCIFPPVHSSLVKRSTTGFNRMVSVPSIFLGSVNFYSSHYSSSVFAVIKHSNLFSFLFFLCSHLSHSHTSSRRQFLRNICPQPVCVYLSYDFQQFFSLPYSRQYSIVSHVISSTHLNHYSPQPFSLFFLFDCPCFIAIQNYSTSKTFSKPHLTRDPSYCQIWFYLWKDLLPTDILLLTPAQVTVLPKYLNEFTWGSIYIFSFKEYVNKASILDNCHHFSLSYICLHSKLSPHFYNIPHRKL